MKFTQTAFTGVYLITIEPHRDTRGYFARTYCQDEFKKQGINFNPVQTSECYTRRKGTIRGIHFQSHPFEEDKLIRCVHGKIFDVVVDLRKHSKTFAKWISFELSAREHNMIYIPKTYAHAYQTLTDDCLFEYEMSAFYSAKHSTGIRWNDSTINISWPIKKNIILSKKDKHLPLL